MIRRLLGDPLIDTAIERAPDWLIDRALAWLGFTDETLFDLFNPLTDDSSED